MRPVTPECMKVESPITATDLPSVAPPLALLKPWRPETEAPMQMVVSMAARGATAPRV